MVRKSSRIHKKPNYYKPEDSFAENTSQPKNSNAKVSTTLPPTSKDGKIRKKLVSSSSRKKSTKNRSKITRKLVKPDKSTNKKSAKTSKTPVSLTKIQSSAMLITFKRQTSTVALTKQISSKKLVKKSKKILAPKAPVVKKPRHPNDKLKPKKNVTVYEKDPTFETKEEIPWISVDAYSRLSIRAVLLNNEALLKRLIDDTKHVSSVLKPRSIDINKNALMYAIEQGNWKLIDPLFHEQQQPISYLNSRVQEVPSLLVTAGTGQSNFHMLGHRVRQIQMTRGSKEGNNALLKDAKRFETNINIKELFKHDIDIALIQQLITKNYVTMSAVSYAIYQAVRFGHRKLAGKLMELYGHTAFNELHKEVLLNDKQSLNPFKPISVKKKGQLHNKSINPIHCACINPNGIYLEALIQADPDYNTADEENRRPLHYAASCEGTAPMKLLLSKGASLFDNDKKGMLPIHVAAEVGRESCLELLCKEMAKTDKASLDRKSRQGMTAMHLAALNGNLDCLETLVNNGASIEVQTGAAKNKMTPLMFAAQAGNLEIIKWMKEKQNAIVDKRDKLKRTALIIAVMNGHANIVSYLLRCGADPDLPDSSGNTPTHYAAAYGWYFCVKLLTEAGAEVNKANDWKLTPLAVAYMKGHIGIADMLLQNDNIDINCQDDKGLTLVSLTLSNIVNGSTIDQLNYLIKEKKADSNIPDSMGNNALHHLAAANFEISRNQKQELKPEDIKKLEVDIFIEIAELLLTTGCDANLKNEENSTPIMCAISSGKVELAEHLLSKGNGFVSDPSELNGEDNVLHDLVKDPGKLSALLFVGMSKKQPATITRLLSCSGTDGYTPLLRAVKLHSQFSHKKAGNTNIKRLVQEILRFAPWCFKQKVGREISGDQNYNVDSDEEEKSECPSESEFSNQTDRDDWDNQQHGNAKKNDKKIKLTDHYQTAFHLAVSKKNSKEKSFYQSLFEVILEEYRSISHLESIGTKLLDVKDGNGHTPLMTAVCSGDCNSAKLLIQANADVNTVYSKTCKPVPEKNCFNEENKNVVKNVSVLMEAVEMKLTEIVNMLLQFGAKIETSDSNGDTAVHYAAKDSSSEMAEIMELLLQNGGSPLAVNKQLRTPLHLACNADTGSTDVSTENVELLLAHKANVLSVDTMGRLPIHYIFVKFDNNSDNSEIDPIALCQVLLPRINHSHPIFMKGDKNEKTALHYAAIRGSNICVLTIVRHSPGLLNKTDGKNNQALGLAIHNGHMACALTLIQANADIKCTINIFGDEKYDSLQEWKKDNQWKFSPTRNLIPSPNQVPYTNEIVKNEWQGIVYVVLNLMESNHVCLRDLTKAAIENKKYNLAITLLRMMKFKFQNTQSIFSTGQSFDENLFFVLAKTAENSDGLQIKVCEAFYQLGIPLVDSNMVPRVAIEAAKKHNYVLLEFLYLHKNCGNKESAFLPLCALLYHWDRVQTSDQCKKWINIFLEEGTKNLNIPQQEYPLAHDFTDQKGRSGLKISSGTHRLHRTSFLIRAIELQNFSLCKFIIQSASEENLDINQADQSGQTAIMVAVRLNNMDIVKLILNHSYEIPENKQDIDDAEDSEEEEDSAIKGRVFGSGAVPKPKSQFSSDNYHLHNEVCMDDQVDVDTSFDHENQTRKRKAKKAMLTKSKKYKKGPHQHLFKKTTNVNLNMKDNKGQSIIHHCVIPFEWGGWENIEMVKLLSKLGAQVDTLDCKRKTPLDYAAEMGQKQMAETLAALGNANVPSVEFENFQLLVSSDFQFTADVQADADKFVALQNEQQGKKDRESREKLLQRPHHLSGYEQTGEIVTCKESNELYKVLLNKVDVQYGAYGYYTFYRMELIRRKGSNLYIVFTNWGRIGDAPGQYQRTPFGKLEDAEKEFKRIFRSKTGNVWSQENNFVEHPKKYKLVRMDETLCASAFHELDINLDSPVKCNLPKEAEALIRNFSDVRSLKISMKHAHATFQFMMPFGNISKERIFSAKEKLNKICENIVDLEKTRKGIHEKENLDKAQRIMNSLCSLSNEFHELIPFGGLTHKQVPVIDNVRLLNEFTNAINNLLEFEVAEKIVAAASYKRKTINPSDYIMKSLGTNIQALDPDAYNAQYILHYIHNSSPTTKVEGIFKVFNEKLSNGFDCVKSVGNHQLLWHGTNAANMLSILKLGLLPAPPQAIHHGYLFGKGIYTADVFAKSMGYCHSQDGTRIKYILLCEVALGRIFTQTSYDFDANCLLETHKGFDSVKMVGRKVPNPNYDITLHTGARVALGEELVESKLGKDERTYIDYNEYIVYDPKQIVIRYIVAFK